MNRNFHFFKSWAMFTFLLYTVVISASAILSVILQNILEMTQISEQIILIIARGLGLILNFYLSFLIFRWSIKKYILSTKTMAKIPENI